MIKLIFIIAPLFFGAFLMGSFNNHTTNHPIETNFDLSSKNNLMGIWRTENTASPIQLFYFTENENPVVVYQSNLFSDTSIYHGVRHTITRVLGDCLFFYESKTQSLEYLATFSNGALTIQKSSGVIQFKKINTKELTQNEHEAIFNSQQDTVIMFQYRKPEVFKYYHCNDTSLRVKEELYEFTD